MKYLKEDAVRIEQIMDRTADNPCDFWQTRYIYWIAVAIYHIILRINKLDERLPEQE